MKIDQAFDLDLDFIAYSDAAGIKVLVLYYADIRPFYSTLILPSHHFSKDMFSRDYQGETAQLIDIVKLQYAMIFHIYHRRYTKQ